MNHPPGWNNWGAGKKAAWTRQHNAKTNSTSRTRTTTSKSNVKRCPKCGFKLPKALFKRIKRKISPAQKRKFSSARKAALAAGWQPFTKMTAAQKKAFSSAFK